MTYSPTVHPQSGEKTTVRRQAVQNTKPISQGIRDSILRQAVCGQNYTEIGRQFGIDAHQAQKIAIVEYAKALPRIALQPIGEAA